MTDTELAVLFAEDEKLVVGLTVNVFWKSAGRSWQSWGVIEKINPSSVKVRLVGYPPAAPLITVPRIDNIKQWTANNCVRLIPETI